LHFDVFVNPLYFSGPSLAGLGISGKKLSPKKKATSSVSSGAKRRSPGAQRASVVPKASKVRSSVASKSKAKKTATKQAKPKPLEVSKEIQLTPEQIAAKEKKVLAFLLLTNLCNLCNGCSFPQPFWQPLIMLKAEEEQAAAALKLAERNGDVVIRY